MYEPTRIDYVREAELRDKQDDWMSASKMKREEQVDEVSMEERFRERTYKRF